MADLVKEWKRAVHEPEVAALRERIAELEAERNGVSSIERDWRSGVISSQEAMLAICQIIGR